MLVQRLAPHCAKSAIALSLGLGLIVAPPALAGTGSTTRASVRADGQESPYDSYATAMSANGRNVLFVSPDNLVSDDTNGLDDLYLYDRLKKRIERVSLGSQGEQGDDITWSVSANANGRFVAFSSNATNLTPGGDANGHSTDVFVRDRTTGRTELVSTSSAGEQGNDYSLSPAISADGRLVVFVSAASNLVPDDTNGATDMFVKDRQTDLTTRVSVSSAGEEADTGAWYPPAISADGRYVAFLSDASNLVPDDSNELFDVFVHDRTTGATVRASVSHSNAQLEDGAFGSRQTFLSLSANGRYVTFVSSATTLVPNDTNGWSDVFVRDLRGGVTKRVNVGPNGEEANGESYEAVISADGRWLAFESYASNLTAPSDPNPFSNDIFVVDLENGQTTKASVDSDGVSVEDCGTLWISIADGGGVVTFASCASNLVANDTNEAWDVFVRVMPR
jgi:Tol biopolymer transport system component